MIPPESQSSSFEEIRETLDPACSYIILERAAALKEERDFTTITDLLLAFEDAILDRQFFYDAGRNCVFLVLKVDSARLDGMVAEFLIEGLPTDITFYIYADRVVG
jgi:hypothetical protein